MRWVGPTQLVQNIDIEARAESIKFEVVPESIRVGMVSGIPRIRVKTKKDMSE